MDTQRLCNLERNVAEIALMITGPCTNSDRLRAIAARLAEPRGEAGNPKRKEVMPTETEDKSQDRPGNRAHDTSPHSASSLGGATAPSLPATIAAIIADDLHLPHSERHRIAPAVDRIMAAVEARAPQTMATALAEKIKAFVEAPERLTEWDSWRKYIAGGGGGSWPRDAYEGVLDWVASECDDLIAAARTSAAEPSEDDLRELEIELVAAYHDADAASAERIISTVKSEKSALALRRQTRAAWRWCRERIERERKERFVNIVSAAVPATPPQPAPAVPAEIVERAKEMQKIKGGAMWGDMRDLIRDLASLPTPAPDPQAVPRQPTNAMLNAARDWSAKFVGKPIGNKAATGCWQAMWDAERRAAGEVA